MNSRHLVDPELAPFLEMFPSVELSHDNLAEVRNRVLPLPPIEESGVDLERIMAPGPAAAPDIPLLVYRPREAARPLPCIYHIHGGGYVLGAARELEPVHRPLAASLGCAIVSVDYRLAPETPFPGPVEDCYAGLAWTFANAAALGIDPARIGVMGESAGGGLAAALALLARDRGEYKLAFQHLIYPMLDDRTCTRDPHPFAGEFIWHAHNNRFGWSALLGQTPGGEGVSPYAAPARATDLAGLPPSFISSGALDLFLEEDLDYTRRLLRAGVPTELHVYPGAFHAFDMMEGAAVAQQARRDSRAALARFLAGYERAVRVDALKTKIVTPLFAETLAFYAGLPGLALVEQWDEPGDKGAILGLSGGAGEAFLELHAGPAGTDFSGLSLQFRTGDVDDFRREIAGRHACEGPVDRPWGSRYLYLVDPNNIRIIIYSEGD